MDEVFLESKKKKFHEIRDFVVNWYEKNCLEREIESFNYDLTKKEDRLKIFVLGVFFNCIFQEEKALEIFREMEKRGYLELDELDDFEGNSKKVIAILEKETGKSHKILKIQSMINSVKALKEMFSKEGDVISIFDEKGNIEEFVRFLYKELSGIKAKLFWICRECRDLFQIPARYCYVPDSHVKKFLYNIGFLSRKDIYSLEEYFAISKNMARFLSNKYFDLPFMRYHQIKCKRCEEGKTSKCEIDCRFAPKSLE